MSTAISDATIIRVDVSVIQVADKSSGGKKLRPRRVQATWENRGGCLHRLPGTGPASGGRDLGKEPEPTLSEYAATAAEKPTFPVASKAQNSGRDVAAGKTVRRQRL